MGDTHVEHVEHTESDLTRREFLKSAATVAAGVAGAGLAVGAARIVRAETRAADPLNLAIIGVGTQGRVLLTNCLKIPGVRFKAVCDIWPYYSGYAARLLGKYQQTATEYADYREMLGKEKGLDAVLVASPDWVHAEHAIACLNAGKHVYCEKEMSNDLTKAADMVRAARQTGKLLQIGHQRRSNPRYFRALEYVQKLKVCGEVTYVQGQWNRSTPGWRTFAQRNAMNPAQLRDYGYGTMNELCNWRWFRKYSGGSLADLGSHQIDVFHWFLGGQPVSVLATGGADYHPGMEWYDNALAMYEWQIPGDGKPRTVRGHYQVCSTSGHGGYWEGFLGPEGSIEISEANRVGCIRREAAAPLADWEEKLTARLKKAATAPAARDNPKEKSLCACLGVGPSDIVKGDCRHYPPIPAPNEDTTEHRPHLENFFAAIRDPNTKLTCPAETAYETTVLVLRANESMAAGRKLMFRPEDFKV